MHSENENEKERFDDVFVIVFVLVRKLPNSFHRTTGEVTVTSGSTGEVNTHLGGNTGRELRITVRVAPPTERHSFRTEGRQYSVWRNNREVAHRPDSHSLYELNSESFSELVTSKGRLRQTHENRVILNTIKPLFTS
jgi:hypothetical protein